MLILCWFHLKNCQSSLRITESQRLEETSGGLTPPAQARYPGLYPDGFWMSLRKGLHDISLGNLCQEAQREGAS